MYPPPKETVFKGNRFFEYTSVHPMRNRFLEHICMTTVLCHWVMKMSKSHSYLYVNIWAFGYCMTHYQHVIGSGYYSASQTLKGSYNYASCAGMWRRLLNHHQRGDKERLSPQWEHSGWCVPPLRSWEVAGKKRELSASLRMGWAQEHSSWKRGW